MIRNIPNKYTQAMLLDILEDLCRCCATNLVAQSCFTSQPRSALPSRVHSEHVHAHYAAVSSSVAKYDSAAGSCLSTPYVHYRGRGRIVALGDPHCACLTTNCSLPQRQVRFLLPAHRLQEQVQPGLRLRELHGARGRRRVLHGAPPAALAGVQLQKGATDQCSFPCYLSTSHSRRAEPSFADTPWTMLMQRTQCCCVRRHSTVLA